MTVSNWIRPRLRLLTIYQELGYNPWHKPKERKPVKKTKGIYMGTKEMIPFLNDDAKRTIVHLFVRPGKMMRDYILRGDQERYLAPLTALLVFYSVFSLLLAVVKPEKITRDIPDDLAKSLSSEVIAEADSTGLSGGEVAKFSEALVHTITYARVLTRLDRYPDAVDTPWKESLAAVESDLRTKGIPLFMNNFLLIWMAFALLLRKYNVSFSGAAAASAYVLCQFCLFMFLALIFSLGEKSELGVAVMGALLFMDFQQMLGVGKRKAFWLTVKTGLAYVGVAGLFYLVLGIVLLIIAYFRAF